MGTKGGRSRDEGRKDEVGRGREETVTACGIQCLPLLLGKILTSDDPFSAEHTCTHSRETSGTCHTRCNSYNAATERGGEGNRKEDEKRKYKINYSWQCVHSTPWRDCVICRVKGVGKRAHPLLLVQFSV